MEFVIAALGILQMLGGVLAYLAARSAVHEILGAISFGMGLLSFALAIALSRLRSIKEVLKGR